MSSLLDFKNFQLQDQLKYLDCGTSELVSYRLPDNFDLGGGNIVSEVEELFFNQQLCSGCKNYIFVDLKKLFKPEVIRETYDELKSDEAWYSATVCLWPKPKNQSESQYFHARTPRCSFFQPAVVLMRLIKFFSEEKNISL